MKKLLLVVAGTGAAAYVAHRVQRAAEAITPEGLRDRAAGWKHGARLFVDDVRDARDAREAELRARWPRGAHQTSRSAAAETDDVEVIEALPVEATPHQEG